MDDPSFSGLNKRLGTTWLQLYVDRMQAAGLVKQVIFCPRCEVWFVPEHEDPDGPYMSDDVIITGCNCPGGNRFEVRKTRIDFKVRYEADFGTHTKFGGNFFGIA